MTPESLDALTRTLSRPGLLTTDLTGFDEYFHDATEFSGRPAGIVFPENETDVVSIVRYCADHSIPIVPRGAGTGLSGGCIPSEASLLLSLERLNHIRIDSKSRTATVGPGAITKRIVDEANKFGLTYPPDPASYEECSIGGNASENAGGLSCRRFGVTRDYVAGMRVVTADAQIMLTGCDATGSFGLGDVIIGSEGTLAVITELKLDLIPAFPPGETWLIAFDHPKDAAQTVSDITFEGITPTIMEYLDRGSAYCSNQYEKTEGLDNAAAILLIETSEGHPGRPQSEIIKSLCERNRASYMRSETDPEKARQLWKVRRNLSKAIKAMAKIRVSEDVSVPVSKFPDLVDYVAELDRQSPLMINSFGHAGDGNLHVAFVSLTGSHDDLELIDVNVMKLLGRTVELGGSVSAEHGIGIQKRHHLPLEFDPATLAFMRDIKGLFDPQNVLNPGKIFEK